MCKDHGGENVLVWEFMEGESGRSLYIAGQSVHNSRIERLWRDVYSSVSSYAALFYDLEHVGALDPTNEADLFPLHYVFLPRINSSLATFTSAWNNHPLSTENYLTPLQINRAYSQGSQLFDEVVDPDLYGYDPNEPHTSTDEEESVVPPTNIPLSQPSIKQLNTAINPMQDCDDFGKQLYLDGQCIFPPTKILLIKIKVILCYWCHKFKILNPRTKLFTLGVWKNNACN